MIKYNNAETLLTAIYDGSKDGNQSRDKKLQEKNFPKDEVVISKDIDLTEEFIVPSKKIRIAIEKGIINHAILAYNKPALKCLLKIQPGLANHFFDTETHPLYTAAKLCSLEMVQILLEAGADPTRSYCKEIDPNNKAALITSQVLKHYFTDVVSAIKEIPEDKFKFNDKDKLKTIKKIVLDAARKLENARAIENSRIINHNDDNDSNDNNHQYLPSTSSSSTSTEDHHKFLSRKER